MFTTWGISREFPRLLWEKPSGYTSAFLHRKALLFPNETEKSANIAIFF